MPNPTYCPLAFLPFTQWISRQPIPENLWPYPIFFLRMPLGFFLCKFIFTPTNSTFGTPSTNNFFIKKIFLKPYLKWLLDITNFFLEFWDSWDPPTNKMTIFAYEMLGSNRVKRVCGAHFWRNVWKIFKNKEMKWEGVKLNLKKENYSGICQKILGKVTFHISGMGCLESFE